MYNYEKYIHRNYVEGDIIKVRSIFTKIVNYPIWHYGVVVGNNDVVHFNLNVRKVNIEIIRTSLDEFVGSGEGLRKCYMSENHKQYSAHEIARRAISQVGTDFGGYDLDTNNCEHFANWCASGERFSNQIPTNEGTQTVKQKVIERATEPIISFCDAGEKWCDRAEKATTKFFDKAIEICGIFGL